MVESEPMRLSFTGSVFSCYHLSFHHKRNSQDYGCVCGKEKGGTREETTREDVAEAVSITLGETALLTSSQMVSFSLGSVSTCVASNIMSVATRWETSKRKKIRKENPLPVERPSVESLLG